MGKESKNRRKKKNIPEPGLQDDENKENNVRQTDNPSSVAETSHLLHQPIAHHRYL